MLETKDKRLNSEAAADEAWEIHKNASDMYMGPGQKLPTSKQLEAASLQLNDKKKVEVKVGRIIKVFRKRVEALSEAVASMTNATSDEESGDKNK